MMECPRCGGKYADNIRYCGVDGAPLRQVRGGDPLLGSVVAGTYRLQSALGSGGYGVVYKASHERLPSFVAVKVLSRLRAKDEVAVARFKREVEAEAVVSHPHVVKVLDYGHDATVGYFIVMEHLEGQDLGTKLEEGKLPHILDTFSILDQAGGALSAAHDLGIVHRDVKADNIFLVADASEPQGFSVKLLDFGVAKLTRPVTGGNSETSRKDLHSTEATPMLGSPCTVSPEILRGQSVDARADVYSFGAMLYEMLTGQILFAARNVESMLERIVYEAPTPPSRVVGADWIGAELDALVLSMLEKKPEHRPRSIDAVLRGVDRIRPDVERAWAAHFLPTSQANKLIEFGFKDRAEATVTNTQAGQVPAHTHVYADHKPITKPPTRATPLVLVVDDDRSVRMITRQLVIAAGFDAEAMEGGREALAWIGENAPPDAMVLDLLMPGLDGIRFLQKLRARGWLGPVVVCSGVGSAVLRAEAERIPGVSFVDKVGELHRVGEALRAMGVGAASA